MRKPINKNTVFVINSRSSERAIAVTPGNRRGGKSKGRRVILAQNDSKPLSVYPADARKFAMELIAMADYCENADD